MKVCSTPNCPVLSDKTRCPEHRREREQTRGSRQQRGYGTDHTQLRNQWAVLVATGNVKCTRCAEYIQAGVAWDLGHDDLDRRKHSGPEHVACNRATAGR